jgi:arylsulfatase A-like enzyme
VSRYLGEITLLDHQIGRVLAELAMLGLAQDTLVVYTSDHGDMCGAHGMMDKHYVMYDDVVRVPLIMRWPGVIPAGQTSAAFVSSALDLAATFCAVAGIPAPATFMGQSLLPLAINGRAENPRPDIFASYHGNQFGLYSQRMVRDGRWKFIWNPTAEDELYDLATDPAELHNRATDPAAAVELERLRERLLYWLLHTKDPLLNEWTQRQLAVRPVAWPRRNGGAAETHHGAPSGWGADACVHRTASPIHEARSIIHHQTTEKEEKC